MSAFLFLCYHLRVRDSLSLDIRSFVLFMYLSCPATISFAAIAGQTISLFFFFAHRIKNKKEFKKIKAFFPVKWKVEYLLFTMISHQDYYQKIASLLADVPPQIVIINTSHSFARVIMMLLGSVKTPRGKKIQNIHEIFR